MLAGPAILAGLVMAIVAGLAPSLTFAEALPVVATPVPLSKEEPGLTTVGRLRYRGGLHIRADNLAFGGLSALGVSTDGQRMVALSDIGQRFSARLFYDRAGNLAGLRDADLGPLAGLEGFPLSSKNEGDAESMTSGVEGEIIVAFERHHRLWRYLPGVTRPVPMPEPPEMLDLPFNNGIEALTLLADGSLLALSEGKRYREAVVGWISDSNGWSVLTYLANKNYRVTGAATLPGGDVLVLERLFTPRGYNVVLLKRVAEVSIKAGLRLEGETVAELKAPLTVDNFEGIEARRGPRGEVLVYLISDDNFNAEQRTLLMMFELAE